MKHTIVGGGLVGSLWAIYLSKAGHEVTVYERRPDMRLGSLYAGRSINLATSYRGWHALQEVGIDADIKKIALPMYGRSIHHTDGTIVYQPYGNHDQAIYSVSRGEINARLVDLAEKNFGVQFYFDHKCVDADAGGSLVFQDAQRNRVEVHAKNVFACDGSFSSVRSHAFNKMDRFDYSQHFAKDGYKELLLPANTDGSYRLDPKSLHIWPKGRFMLIALPNLHGSFTCTLFMPIDEDEYCFSKLDTDDKVIAFFKEVFPDFYEVMPDLLEQWHDHTMSSLVIVRCYPWTYKNTVLMGDAAHATVPFYGQGMNCGFEDCSVMWSLMQKYGDEDWVSIFNHYQLLRKPNCDAMQDLSNHNYIVMRDKVADPDFLLLQKIERRINLLYPNKYFPLYSMVSFTPIDYKDAWSKGQAQQIQIEFLIDKHQITHQTSEDVIDNIIHQYMTTHE